MKSMFIFKSYILMKSMLYFLIFKSYILMKSMFVLFVLQITKLPLSLYLVFVLEARHDCNKVYAIYSYLCSLNISSFGSSY